MLNALLTAVNFGARRLQAVESQPSPDVVVIVNAVVTTSAA